MNPFPVTQQIAAFFEKKSADISSYYINSSSYDLFRKIQNSTEPYLSAATKVLFSREDRVSHEFQLHLLQQWCWRTMPAFDQGETSAVIKSIMQALTHSSMNIRYKLYGLFFCSRLSGISLICPKSIREALLRIQDENDDLQSLVKCIFGIPDNVLSMNEIISELNKQGKLIKTAGTILILLAPYATPDQAKEIVKLCMMNYEVLDASDIPDILEVYAGRLNQYNADQLCHYITSHIINQEGNFDRALISALESTIKFISDPVFDALINTQTNSIRQHENKEKTLCALEVLRLCVDRAGSKQISKIHQHVYAARVIQDADISRETFITLLSGFHRVNDTVKNKILMIVWKNLNSCHEFVRQITTEFMPELLKKIPESLVNTVFQKILTNPTFSMQDLQVIYNLLPVLKTSQAEQVNAFLLACLSSFNNDLHAITYDILIHLAFEISPPQVHELHPQVTTLTANNSELSGKAENLKKIYAARVKEPEYPPSLSETAENLLGLLAKSQEDDALDAIAIMRSLRYLCHSMDQNFLNRLSVLLLPLLSDSRKSYVTASSRTLAEMIFSGKLTDTQFELLLSMAPEKAQAQITLLYTLNLLYQEVGNTLHYQPVPSVSQFA